MLETRDGCEVSLYTRVIPLVSGHCSVIYSLMNGIYCGLGECISYRVVLALDVAFKAALESVSATGCPCPGYGIYSGYGEYISYGVVHGQDVASMYGGSGEYISYRIVTLDMASMVPLVSASATELSLP